MSDAGTKIIAALQDAIDGNLARVTIGGMTWAPVKNHENISELVKAIEKLSEIYDNVWVQMSPMELNIVQAAWNNTEKALSKVKELL